MVGVACQLLRKLEARRPKGGRGDILPRFCGPCIFDDRIRWFRRPARRAR